ncbi:MAG: SusC/RagA family TonB-linked outer membrane protein [Tannerella sp.]|nr:SusC/RagA family TonB-linked outer membrane protein [Tannerella sp.]
MIQLHATDIYSQASAVHPQNTHVLQELISETEGQTEAEPNPSESSSDQNQKITISGIVKDTNDEPIIGANIIEKGSVTNGTTSDEDGNFTLNVPSGATLVVSFIGYYTQEVVIGNQTNISVTLVEDANLLEEVVVTALGLERKSKSLTYSVQQVRGDELTRSKETNMINSLQGKTAGLIITPNATGAGSSSNILLRGNKSLNGNNMAMVVIDGVPMLNYSSTQQGELIKGRDGGDSFSNINPEDIASISVLKGASAAALYGSMAANGVVMITTKKGRSGVLNVDVNSNTMFEDAISLPKLQSTYGAVQTGDALAQQSWGDKITGKAKGANRLDDFFRTGSTFINSVTVSGGTEKVQSFFSYANTYANGIMPTNNFQRHQFTLRESFGLFKDRLKIDASVSYLSQKVHNRPHGSTYQSPIPGVYTFPANGDWKYYKKNYAIFDPVTHLYSQEWYTTPGADIQNPYFMIHRVPTNETREHLIAAVSFKLNITDFLNLQGRYNYDDTKDFYEQKKYSGTAAILMATPKGAYNNETYRPIQTYGDLILNFNKKFSDFEINASAGASFMETKTTSTSLASGDLILPDLFLYENFLVQAGGTIGGMISGGAANGIPNSQKRLNSTFGVFQIGYKEMVYLDVTERNDWSSALAYTNNVFYSYPSVGVTALLNEITDLGDKVDLLKVRASYSIVGNDVPAYITYPMAGIAGTITSKPFDTMKPEKLHSIELGFEASLFNRLNLDFTWYKTNSRNQYFSMDSSPGTGFTNYYINAGDIQNTGIELTAGYFFDLGNDLTWKTNFNMSYNKNKIIDLYDGLPETGIWGNMNGTLQLQAVTKVGGQVGDLWGYLLARDEKGVLVLDANGNPTLTTEKKYIGNRYSPWGLGWSNSFNYKDFNLYFLVDGMVGGVTCSMTRSVLDQWGVSQATADARDAGGVDIGNGTRMDAQKYYASVAGVQKAVGEYVYSATNFRMREASFGYTFRNLFGASKNLTLALTGRNLFFFYKKAPNDPGVSLTTGTGLAAVDYYGLPSTRSYGLNLKVNF